MKSLLQNASGFLYKIRKIRQLLQNTMILLQNATVLYKIRQLLQNAMILLQNETFITKCICYTDQ